MIEFQHFSTFFNQVGAAALLVIVFWWVHKSEIGRMKDIFGLVVAQNQENNKRVDKMIDNQREDSQRNFEIMRDNQDVLLLQTRSIEQLGEGMRDLSKKFEDYIYTKNRRKENEPNHNAAKV